MSGIKVIWDIGLFDPEKHYIYRSASPIDPNNLPTPIAEVGQGISEYTDLTITDNETYHYFVAAEKRGLLVPAESSVRIYPINLGPGPWALIGGDMSAGFFGEVSTDELITGDALASEIGLTSGTAQYSTEPWLKFALDWNILYVAKKSYRHRVTWEDIHEANAVYNNSNSRSVSIGEHEFLVTILTGGNGDPASSSGGEWNNLIYRIHENDPSGSPWASYSNADINIGSGNGRQVWCQESEEAREDNAVSRGASGIENILFRSKTYDHRDFGWRPVLRLQQ